MDWIAGQPDYMPRRSWITKTLSFKENTALWCKSLLNYISEIISKFINFPQNHIRCRCSIIAHVKALVTLSIFQKRWGCLAWRKGKKKCGLNQKRRRKKEKHGKLVNNGTLLYTGLYFIFQKRCRMWSCINNQEDYWHF